MNSPESPSTKSPRNGKLVSSNASEGRLLSPAKMNSMPTTGTNHSMTTMTNLQSRLSHNVHSTRLQKRKFTASPHLQK